MCLFFYNMKFNINYSWEIGTTPKGCKQYTMCTTLTALWFDSLLFFFPFFFFKPFLGAFFIILSSYLPTESVCKALEYDLLCPNGTQTGVLCFKPSIRLDSSTYQTRLNWKCNMVCVVQYGKGGLNYYHKYFLHLNFRSIFWPFRCIFAPSPC